MRISDFIYIYGWFILLIVVIIGTLFYMGVKNDIIFLVNSTNSSMISRDLCKTYCEENEGQPFKNCNSVGDLVHIVCGEDDNLTSVTLTKISLLRIQ